MNLPEPRPGLVVCYSYLWWDEARQGQEEGRKDRPCVVILAVRAVGAETRVTVAPITHSPPTSTSDAVAIPAATKIRLGLDDLPSWIVTNDLNSFSWPGVDLRPVRRGAKRCDFGVLPTALLAEVRNRVLATVRVGHARLTPRSE